MRILIYILLVLCLFSCREDELVSYATDTPLDTSAQLSATIQGMYVLCEGNMGANKCTLDYLDLSGSWNSQDGRVHYWRNIYGQQNPSTVFELGDVGNDVQIYGSRLWMVINCSNKVEVCQVSDARRLGQVNIANPRYITFHQGFAYVSSYVGGVQQAGEAPLGCVYKVDTLTLQKVDSVLVGYQPEEMAVQQGRLYVANSGGYRAPDYDHTVSIIDLSAPKMQVTETLDVAPNLHHVVADQQENIWITSRGNYADIPARLHCISGRSIQTIDVPVSSFSLAGDTLFCLSSTEPLLTLIDTRSGQLISLPAHWQQPVLEHPYGIIANPVTRDFYLMDAKNYVSSGQLLHFLPDGTFDWRVWTGDIPSRAVFVGVSSHQEPADTTEVTTSLYIAGVDEYVPAPGQFVNTLPVYDDGDDAATMAQKCYEAIGENRGGLVTLGGYGGYLTFHFAEAVRNHAGPDLCIFGNANINGSEAGIVLVSADTNGNHLPDDAWYELSGSADTDSIGLVTYGYCVTYSAVPMSDIPWTDNQQCTGKVLRNPFHSQEYYPLWLPSELTFTGTRLPNNGFMLEGNSQNWVLQAFRAGYVDNLPNKDKTGNQFDLDWAVDPLTRQPVSIDHADFIRVYTGLNQYCGWLGETSTEISGAEIIK